MPYVNFTAQQEINAILSSNGIDLYTGDDETPFGSVSFTLLIDDYINWNEAPAGRIHESSRQDAEQLLSNLEDMVSVLKTAL